MLYRQFGVHLEQLLHLVLHRQDATYHHGALCIYHDIALEHLGKALIHAAGYLPVLLGSKLGELSQAACCLVAEHRHASEHILSERRKLAEAVGTGKDTHRDIIVVRTYQIARAVAAVMTYIKGL